MKRKTNQDSICLAREDKFFVVADGMGGHNGGDIASQMSVRLLPEFISENKNSKDTNELLAEAIQFVNRSIYDHGQQNEELKGMGTTISLIYFDDKYLNIANIGDSRVYMMQDESLYQLTRDHSLVQEKLNLGIYDREGAKADPQKNVLTKTVGFESEVKPDIYKYRASKGDLFLICSDGLHGKVSDPDLLNIVKHHIPEFYKADKAQLNNAVKHLIQQANHNGGQDNISVILVVMK